MVTYIVHTAATLLGRAHPPIAAGKHQQSADEVIAFVGQSLGFKSQESGDGRVVELAQRCGLVGLERGNGAIEHGFCFCRRAGLLGRSQSGATEQY